MWPTGLPSGKKTSDIECTSPTARENASVGSWNSVMDSRTRCIVRDYIEFLRHSKKVYMIPIVILLLLLGVIIVIGGTAAAPLIYTLF